VITCRHPATSIQPPGPSRNQHTCGYRWSAWSARRTQTSERLWHALRGSASTGRRETKGRAHPMNDATMLSPISRTSDTAMIHDAVCVPSRRGTPGYQLRQLDSDACSVQGSASRRGTTAASWIMAVRRSAISAGASSRRSSMGFAPFGFAPPCRGRTSDGARRSDGLGPSGPARPLFTVMLSRGSGLSTSRGCRARIHGSPATDVPDDSVHDPASSLRVLGRVAPCATCLILSVTVRRAG